MTPKQRLLVLAAGAAFLAAAPFVPSAWAVGNCAPTDKIDSSTWQQAKKKMQAAGYADVHDLKKGCDNYWHGKALKGGQAVRVVLSPQGQVMEEGD
jgi:hypothetical protein